MPDLDEVLKSAEKAKEHARSRVKKGSTHVDGVVKRANDPDINLNTVELEALKDMRERIFNDACNAPNPLEKNYQEVLWFEANIKYINKYSLGNCYEFALEALDYVLNTTPEIDAEVFQIKRGDHYFIVLNRDPNSNPKKPETWGKDAVICDPWLNEAYPASDYINKLGEYYDPSKGHKIDIGDHTFTVENLYQKRTVENLKKNFLKEVQVLVATLNECKENLTREKDALNKVGKEAGRFAVFNKTRTLDALIAELNKVDCKEYNEESNYRKTRSALLDQLEILTQKAEHYIQFSPEEKQTLGFFTEKQKEAATNKPRSQDIVAEAGEKLRKR